MPCSHLFPVIILFITLALHPHPVCFIHQIKRVQDSLTERGKGFAKALVSPESLHFTLVVLTLPTPEYVERAQKVRKHPNRHPFFARSRVALTTSYCSPIGL